MNNEQDRNEFFPSFLENRKKNLFSSPLFDFIVKKMSDFESVRLSDIEILTYSGTKNIEVITRNDTEILTYSKAKDLVKNSIPPLSAEEKQMIIKCEKILAKAMANKQHIVWIISGEVTDNIIHHYKLAGWTIFKIPNPVEKWLGPCRGTDGKQFLRRDTSLGWQFHLP